MKILFYSQVGKSLPLALRCASEGNSVRFYVADHRHRSQLNGLITRTDTPDAAANELVVFDSLGQGRRADELRRRGHAVVGGCEFADNMVLTPGYADSILKLAGVEEIPTEYDIEGWFNGDDWVLGLTTISVSERRFLTGDLGQEVDCVGTTLCYWKKYRPSSFKGTLYKLTRFLRKVNYCGPISTQGGKITAGLCFDHAVVACNLVNTDYSRILNDCARGAIRRIVPSFDYGVGIRVSLPPWPNIKGVVNGVAIEGQVEGWFPYNAWIGVAVGTGSSINQAQEAALATAQRLGPRDVQYRVDIGVKAKQIIPGVLSKEVRFGK